MQFWLFWESSSTYQTWIITGWHAIDVYSSCDFKWFPALQFDNQNDPTQPRMFVYVEAWPSVEGDGMLSGRVLSWLRSQPISWILWNYISHHTSLIFPAFASLRGPMIASFFDGSNISADQTSSDLSPVLIVEDIPIVSNWSLKTCLNLKNMWIQYIVCIYMFEYVWICVQLNMCSSWRCEVLLDSGEQWTVLCSPDSSSICLKGIS